MSLFPHPHGAPSPGVSLVYGWVRVAAGPSGSCELELAFLLEPGCPEQYSGEAAKGEFCEPDRMETSGHVRNPGGSPPRAPGAR